MKPQIRVPHPPRQFHRREGWGIRTISHKSGCPILRDSFIVVKGGVFSQASANRSLPLPLPLPLPLHMRKSTHSNAV